MVRLFCGTLCERDWREMGHEANRLPIHLCRAWLLQRLLFR